MSFEGQTRPTKTGKEDTINQSEREANTGSSRQWRENTRKNVTVFGLVGKMALVGVIGIRDIYLKYYRNTEYK